MNVAPAKGTTATSPVLLKASTYLHSASPAFAHASTTWFIRTSNGSYAAPVFRMTSTTNLISIAVPPGLLTAGKTYFWKCSYLDTKGHPSMDSAETSFQAPEKTDVAPSSPARPR